MTNDDEQILLSLWQLPDRVMLGLFNYDQKRAKDVTLKLDLARLGLAASIECSERQRTQLRWEQEI